MKHNLIFKIIAVLVLVGAVIGLGIFSYRAGMSQGLALDPQQFEGGRFPTVPDMAYGHPRIGFFGLLVPLFLMLMAFSAIRALVWGGTRHWHHMHGYRGMHPGAGYGYCERGVPPIFDEWHRRAHDQGPDADKKSPGAEENTPE